MRGYALVLLPKSRPDEPSVRLRALAQSLRRRLSRPSVSKKQASAPVFQRAEQIPRGLSVFLAAAMSVGRTGVPTVAELWRTPHLLRSQPRSRVPIEARPWRTPPLVRSH